MFRLPLKALSRFNILGAPLVLNCPGFKTFNNNSHTPYSDSACALRVILLVSIIRPLLVENVFQVTRPHLFFSAASKAHYVLLLFTRLCGHEQAFLLNTN